MSSNSNTLFSSSDVASGIRAIRLSAAPRSLECVSFFNAQSPAGRLPGRENGRLTAPLSAHRSSFVILNDSLTPLSCCGQRDGPIKRTWTREHFSRNCFGSAHDSAILRSSRVLARVFQSGAKPRLQRWHVNVKLFTMMDAWVANDQRDAWH